jgi:hypothetical protein
MMHLRRGVPNIGGQIREIERRDEKSKRAKKAKRTKVVNEGGKRKWCADGRAQM